MKRELEISQRTKIELDQQMDKLIKERELLHEKLEKASYPEDVRVRGGSKCLLCCRGWIQVFVVLSGVCLENIIAAGDESTEQMMECLADYFI
jgi:hypothetical protein